jgi:hypothetical protein
MMIGDRLTRSMAARFLWGGLAVLCLVGVYFASSEKTTELNAQILQAQERAKAYANTTISDIAIVDTRANSITFDKKTFEIATEGDIFTDPTVARLRVWDGDGLLLASSDPSEVVGELASSDPLLTAALADHPQYQVVDDQDFTYSTVGSPGLPTSLVETFTPFRVKDQVRPVGAVQVDFLYTTLLSAAAEPWDTWMRAFIVLAVLFAALFVISMLRKPLPRGQSAVALTVPADDTGVAAPVVPAPAAESSHLEEELKVAREQLQQASEAFAFLEAKMKEGPGGQASSVDVDAAMARIGELEAALKQAEDDAAQARSMSQDDLDKVRQEADERIADLQRQMEEATKPDPELEELRVKLADTEQRAQNAETALASARAAVKAAKQDVEDAPETTSVDLIEELEAKVAEAEARAKEAEEEAMKITPEATDLRSKLAQAAARKKLGSSS